MNPTKSTKHTVVYIGNPRRRKFTVSLTWARPGPYGDRLSEWVSAPTLYALDRKVRKRLDDGLPRPRIGEVREEIWYPAALSDTREHRKLRERIGIHEGLGPKRNALLARIAAREAVR